MGQDNPFLIELLSLITAFGQLSAPAETDTKKIRIRRRDKEILKERLASLAKKSPEIRIYLQETADEYNNRTADTTNLRAFHALLKNRPSGLPIGGSQPTKSITDGFSTSMIWRPFQSKKNSFRRYP